jgi:hypothetical protein
MDEDLLVTNAFYPIISIKDTGVVQKGNTEYNYYRDTKKPYLRENLGPYPNIKLHEDKFYDDRTQKDFKSYLKKKEKLIDDQTFTPSMKERNIDTTNKFGSSSSNLSGSLQTTEIKKKDFGNDLLKYSQAEEGFDEASVSRVVRDTVYTIDINSRWRDGSYINSGAGNTYTYEFSNSPDSYTITLAKPIRNIKMVEMKSSEFPYSFPCVDTSLANSIPVEYYYFIISIDELNNLTNSGIIIINPQFESSAANVSNFFTKVQLNGTKPTALPNGTFVTNSILYNCHIPYTSVYTNAIPEVSKLTIRFLMPNGYPYKMTDHSFTLEFITYTDSTSVTDISTRRGATDITVFNKILK